jgi:hypothetical protein
VSKDRLERMRQSQVAKRIGDGPPVPPPPPPKKPVVKLRPPTDCEVRRRFRRVPRLPDGARFAARYDEAAQRWTGSLTIPRPGHPSGDLVLQNFKSGVFRLLELLDENYRVYVREKEKEAREAKKAAKKV